MKIEFNFRPDVIIFFRYIPEKYLKQPRAYTHEVDALWGDKSIYDNGFFYIQSLLLKEDCIIALKKGLGAYKVFPASMPT